jgi:hypothetical protein
MLRGDNRLLPSGNIALDGSFQTACYLIRKFNCPRDLYDLSAAHGLSGTGFASPQRRTKSPRSVSRRRLQLPTSSLWSPDFDS